MITNSCFLPKIVETSSLLKFVQNGCFDFQKSQHNLVTLIWHFTTSKKIERSPHVLVFHLHGPPTAATSAWHIQSLAGRARVRTYFQRIVSKLFHFACHNRKCFLNAKNFWKVLHFRNFSVGVICIGVETFCKILYTLALYKEATRAKTMEELLDGTKISASFETAALFPSPYRRVKTAAISKPADSFVSSSRSYIVQIILTIFKLNVQPYLLLWFEILGIMLLKDYFHSYS